MDDVGTADIKDTEIVVSLDGQVLGTFPVDNTHRRRTDLYDNYGTAAVSVVAALDAHARQQRHSSRSTGANTGTSVIVPLTIDKADSTTVGLPNKTFANSKGNGVIQYETTVTAQWGTPVDGRHHRLRRRPGDRDGDPDGGEQRA